LHKIYDFYEQLKGELAFNRFEVNNLLFVEYNCPLEMDSVEIWSKSDYIVYVLSGKKTWETRQKSWTIEIGEALYIKKGANVLHQSFDESFCMLGFFISDDIIRATIEELKGKVAIPAKMEPTHENIVQLESIPNLESFYQSMLFYFRSSQAPMSSILELKAKELLMHIIHAGNHLELSAYFNAVANSQSPSLPHIMEANFNYNLQLGQFAELCNRSLSSFKRDFKDYYQTTPGKWLLEKRLKYAANRLISTEMSISEVAYESGFEDISHFGKTFREEYGKSPSKFRKEA
jgi:AraC-like DNA-binding protein